MALRKPAHAKKGEHRRGEVGQPLTIRTQCFTRRERARARSKGNKEKKGTSLTFKPRKAYFHITLEGVRQRVRIRPEGDAKECKKSC